tara:strand:- start:63 stop:3158 length:3096 start_codon:yes stop_codon:yes gene_type:complete
MADYTAYELGNILKRLEKKVDAALCCCESLDMKNLGLGVPIYVGRFKNHLKIRSLVAGTNMNITYDSNTITFDSLAGGFSCSDLASCSTSNLPEGSNLYYTDARVLSYMTGKNISIFTNDSGYITSSALTPYLTISTAASTYETIIAPGTTLDYWRGDKTWQPFPKIPSGGGGGGVVYYMNGGVPSSEVGYEQLSKIADLGPSADFTITGNGLICEFVTDPADPSLLNIPGGSWVVQFYASMSSAGGTPAVYVEMGKYNGSGFTLIASSVLNPEDITNGTSTEFYTTSIAVPSTPILITDRIAVKFYAVSNPSRDITIHTQDANLSSIITTFSTGITALNTLTAQVQTFTNDTNVTIVSSVDDHKITWAGTLADGRIASATTWNNKQNALSGTGVVKSTAGTISYINGTSGQYIAGDGSLISFPSIPTVGTWGALNYPAWTTGIPFVKMTAAGTFALDTNTYLTSAVTSVATSTGLTGGTITSTGTLSLNSKLAPLDTLTGNSLKLARVNLGETAVEYFTPTYGTGSVTSVGTTGLISGGPITTTGTITTSMNTNKLVGRSSVGTGIMEEITVGSGLTLSGGTLTNTATPTTLGYYGAFQDVTNQTAAVINTGYPMLLGVTDLSNGVTVVSGSRITIANTGIYNIQFSAQFRNPTANIHDVTIWLRKNGVDVPGSSGIVAVTSSHGGVDGHVLPSWNFLIDPIAGDYYEFVWSTSNINVFISFEPAGTPPPSTASVVLTVTQQSGIMAGTGITAINSLTGAAQTMVAGTSGTDFAVSSVGTTHTLNLPTASATNRGALSTTDWSAFNGKLSTTLTNGNVFVGNVSNVATSVAMSGDATIINTGAITIANNAVTDAKLRQSAGLSLVGRSTNSTGNVADITASTANSALRLNAAGNTLAFSTAPLSVLISNHGNTAALSSTTYIQMTGAAASVAVASIASRQTAFPIASTAQNMYVKTNASQSATGSLVISLTIATTPSALSVTIAAGSAIGTFSNTSSAVAIAAGNLLTYEIKNNATATSASVITISTCFY